MLLLPGWLSDGGAKSLYLRSLGCDVTTPRLPDWSFGRAVRAARAACDGCRPDVIVGSSRGGAVAMSLGAAHIPLVLLAPAWRWFGVAPAVRPPAVVLHSPHDRLVRPADSRALCRRNPTARLVEVGADHRLNDPAACAALAAVLDDLFPDQES